MHEKSRIIKNTLIMYVSMAISIVVSLYTSRVILDTLGIVDFGIYSVIGGLVFVFSIVSATMSGSVQRYLSVALAMHDEIKVTKIFSASVYIHLVFVGVVLVMGELLGYWFISTLLNVPIERRSAAYLVYHLVLMGFALQILSIPVQALFNAYEKMGLLAIISLILPFSRLFAALILVYPNVDKLELYATLLFIASIVEFFVYYWLAIKKIETCRIVKLVDKKLYAELFSFSSWGLIGDLSAVAKNQGVPIVLNLFHGPIVNAAYGIASQVSNQVTNLALMIVKATNPQIIQNYASNNKILSFKLVSQSSKICFSIMFIMSLPLLFETEYILMKWLNVIPPYSVEFVRLSIVTVIIESLAPSLMTLSRASGKIKLFQIVVGTLLLLNLPILFWLLCLGLKPGVAYIITAGLALLALVARLVILNITTGFSLLSYFHDVLFKIILFLVLMMVLVWVLYVFSGFEYEMLNILFLPLISCIVTWFVILTHEERKFFTQKLLILFNKRGEK